MSTPIGRIVDPQDLFGRERELTHFWDLFKRTGSNVLLSAPRRVGKSSFLARLEYDAPTHGYCPVRFSLPDCMSEDVFASRLLTESWNHDNQKPWFKKIMDSSVGKIAQSIQSGKFKFDPHQPRSWEELSGAVQQMLKASEEPKLFLIDELPLFVVELLRVDPDRSRAKRLLGWMKTLREDTRHRWLFAGSIGLETIATRHRLSGTIADLHIVDRDFGPFTREIAEQFIRREAEHFGEGEINQILALTDAYHTPYYLLLMIEEMRRARSEGTAFSEIPLLQQRTNFNHWNERLEDIFGQGTRDQVDRVLSGASVSSNGILKDKAIELLGVKDAKSVLDVLIRDGYLRRDGERLRFRCELVRRYWQDSIAA